MARNPPADSTERDYAILLMYINHARTMSDALAIEATAKKWKSLYGVDLPEDAKKALVHVGPMIDPESHWQNKPENR
jgi:predicted GIY-YIG superfamily endonuclease